MFLYIITSIAVLIGIYGIYQPNEFITLFDHILTQINNEINEVPPPVVDCCYIIPNNNFKKNIYNNNIKYNSIEEIYQLNDTLINIIQTRIPFVLKKSESGIASVKSWHSLALHTSNSINNKLYKTSNITTIYGEIYIGTHGMPLIRKPIRSIYPSVAKKLMMEDDLFPLIGDDVITSTKDMRYIDYLHIYNNISLMNNMYLFSSNYRIMEGLYGHRGRV